MNIVLQMLLHVTDALHQIQYTTSRFVTSPFWFTGFSVNASSERLNMGEIETLEDY